EPIELEDGCPNGEFDGDARRTRLQLRAEDIDGPLELTPRDVVLRRVVPEERSSADADSVCDGIHGRAFEAVLMEEGERRLLDVCVGGRARPAERSRGRSAGLDPGAFQTHGCRPFPFGT